MKSLAHLSDAALRHELIAAVARDRITTAELLAHIAEFDSRKLYVPEGYSSMHAYCVEELHLSEDAAYKRIQASRVVRRFPALLEALVEGRLHLAAVCLLAPHLTAENSDELIGAAAHRRKSEVENLLARRLSPLPVLRAESPGQLAPGQVEGEIPLHDLCEKGIESPNGSVPNHSELAPGQVGEPEYSCSAPSRRYPLHLSLPQSTHEKLTHASELLSHAIPSGDAVQVLDRALDALIANLEKRRIGAGRDRTSRPVSGMPTRVLARNRYIPARVRRAVWERDKGQCTFMSKSGHRCGTRRFLQFDHVEPVARGGEATVQGIRLRCRAHNQYEAERVFGSEFMRQKREKARLAVVEARRRAEARREEKAQAEERVRAVKEQEKRAHAIEQAKEQAKDVLAGLRGLGCRPDQAKRAAQFVETLSCETLEERMRAALGFFNRGSARFSVSGSTG